MSIEYFTQYINDTTAIKIIKRKHFILCNKPFNYVPINKLIHFIYNSVELINTESKHLTNLLYLWLLKDNNITNNFFLIYLI